MQGKPKLIVANRRPFISDEHWNLTINCSNSCSLQMC